MIAAVLDERGSRAARARLESLGKIAGLVMDDLLTDADACLMTWKQVHEAAVDRETRSTTLGRTFAPLEAPSLDAAEKLRGDFALIAMAPSALLLARGRFGGRPIFFSRERNGSCIVACSRLEPLLRTLEHPPSIDRQAIAALLASPCALRSRSPYVGIERVEGGEILLVGKGSTARRSLAPFVATPLFSGSVDDAGEELCAHVDRAVSRSIAGKKRVAVLTSGGIDSSTLLASAVAAARGASKSEIDAISLYFSDIGDDRPHLDALVHELSITPLKVAPEACCDPIDRTFVLDAAPFVWPAGGWLSKLGRLAKDRGADLVLTGTGGDELFGLGLDTFSEQARRGDRVGAVRGALGFQAQFLPSAFGRLDELVVRPLARSWLQRWPLLNGLRALRTSLLARAPEWHGPALRDALSASSADPTDPAPLGDTDAATLDAYARAPHLTDCADMRAQLEIDTDCARSDPFLDDELAGFLARLPRSYSIHGGRYRGLLLHAMRRRLPKSVLARQDKGAFGQALSRSFDAAKGATTAAHLSSMRELSRLQLVDAAVFRRRLTAFLSDADARASGAGWVELWPALVLEAFLRRRPQK